LREKVKRVQRERDAMEVSQMPSKSQTKKKRGVRRRRPRTRRRRGSKKE
jgi:hypothetical protein